MADPRDALEAGARQYLASLSDAQFNQLVAETREPKDPDEAQTKKPEAEVSGIARGREAYAKSQGWAIEGPEKAMVWGK